MSETIRTHEKIDPVLCGVPADVSEGEATVRLRTTSVMSADEKGLVHGGFAFGAADYAAMLAVNDPNVVLGSAETRFLAPVRVGELMVFRATIEESRGRKRVISVTGHVDEREVFSGTFTAFVLDSHVLGDD